jgi:hypothetical protein
MVLCCGPGFTVLVSRSPPIPPVRVPIFPVPSVLKLPAMAIGRPLPLPCQPCNLKAYWPCNMDSFPVGALPQFAVGAPPKVTVAVEDLSATSVVSPGSETVAVLAMLPVAAPLTPTVSVIFPVAEPLATGPGFVHVTTCETAAHVQFVPVPLTNVNAALSVSVTVIVPVVAAVPTLLTAIWNVPFDPATKLPEVVLVIERSGEPAVTVTVAVDELFAALLSSVVATVAVLLMLPEAAAFTATVSTMFAAAALPAIGPEFVQVTTCATAAQAQPVPVPETNVKLALSVSVTVIPPTVGPVLTLFTAMANVALVPATKLLDAVFTMFKSGAAIIAT